MRAASTISSIAGLMQARLAESAAGGTFVLVFEPGEEVITGLTEFTRREGIRGAHFIGLGAFREVTFAYFVPETRRYEETRIEEQVEALSLVGNLGRLEGEPRVHAHVVVGRRDGSTSGGHLVRAIVDPTLEVVASLLSIELRRAPDPRTGLALIRHREVDDHRK
jgi:hypothetical protein